MESVSEKDVRKYLLEIPWFQEQTPDHVIKIAQISFVRSFRECDIFFREGDHQDFFYIVLNGRVALDIYVPHRGKVRFYTAEQWDVFGWSSITPVVRTRTASAVGVIAGAVVGIDAQKLRHACENDPALGYRVMMKLANVIASRLMVTRLQLVDMFTDSQKISEPGE